MLPNKFRFIWPSSFRGEDLNRPIRHNNCLWWPCVLMDATHQVSVHLAEGFQRRRLKCEKLKDDGCKVMAKAHVAFGKVS